MTKPYYRLTGAYLFEEDIGWYYTYGIEVLLPDGSKRNLPDISCDREEVQALVNACREHQLDPGQLNDVIENFLS